MGSGKRGHKIPLEDVKRSFKWVILCTICLLDKPWKRVSLCMYFDKIFVLKFCRQFNFVCRYNFSAFTLKSHPTIYTAEG